MQAFCSTSLRVITGPALTDIILAPASAQAHWGHLGELAGHGHDHSHDHDHDHGHRHHPYPHADHPLGAESVRNRKPSSKSGG